MGDPNPPEIIGGQILPVLVIDDAGLAPALGRALLRGGITWAEVTLRTPAALDAIRALADNPDLVVGAGTVTHPDQIDAAARAGARFIVCPGLSAAVVARCRQLGLPVVPGVATATEVMHALEFGLTLLKFFPAATSGAVPAVQALGGPFPQARFIPTGGIGPDNAQHYLSLPNVVAVGGSWLAPPALQAGGDFDVISERAAAALALTTGAPR
jgi:2-dehydro-3-deoxyphosphogluconate aldolase/(4S)-4-hydroxy-2-oxoglutarate aldolase